MALFIIIASLMLVIPLSITPIIGAIINRSKGFDFVVNTGKFIFNQELGFFVYCIIQTID